MCFESDPISKKDFPLLLLLHRTKLACKVNCNIAFRTYKLLFATPLYAIRYCNVKFLPLNFYISRKNMDAYEHQWSN